MPRWDSPCEKLKKANTAQYLMMLVTQYLNTQPAIFASKLPHLLTPGREEQEDDTNYVNALWIRFLIGGTGCWAQVASHPRDQEVLHSMEKVITDLLEEWMNVGHIFSRGQRMAMPLALTATFIAIKMGLGKMDEAVEGALLVTECAKDPLFPCIFAIIPLIYFPCKTLLETRNYQALRTLVSILQWKNGGTLLDHEMLREFKPFVHYHEESYQMATI